MARIVRVAGIQNSRELGNKAGNIASAMDWIRRAAGAGARIVALPELSTTGYICSTIDDAWFATAETIPGQATDEFARLASDLDVSLIVPLYEIDAETRVHYNSAAVITPDKGVIGKYRKRHLPMGPKAIEKYYFTAGNLRYPVFDIGVAKVGITICYDRHFPECFRHMALKGVEVVFSVNNTASRRSHAVWNAEMIANASTNGIFLVQINAFGDEGVTHFPGRSAIVGPDGEILMEVHGEEHVLLADLDLDAITEARLRIGAIRDTIWSDLGLEQPDEPYVKAEQRVPAGRI